MSNTMVIDQGNEIQSITYIIIPDSDIDKVEKSIIEFLSKSYDEVKNHMKEYKTYRDLFNKHIAEGGKWSKYKVEAYYETSMQIFKKISAIYYFPFH